MDETEHHGQKCGEIQMVHIISSQHQVTALRVSIMGKSSWKRAPVSWSFGASWKLFRRTFNHSNWGEGWQQLGVVTLRYDTIPPWAPPLQLQHHNQPLIISTLISAGCYQQPLFNHDRFSHVMSRVDSSTVPIINHNIPHDCCLLFRMANHETNLVE